MIEYDTVLSPCISNCTLDKHYICKGCFRSKQEIADWYTLDNEDKKKILALIKERK
jgi:predicted Fe-S protein YdhL (DUF1289 family)